MVVDVVCGQFQQELHMLLLKFGAAERLVKALVVVRWDILLPVEHMVNVRLK